MSKGFTKFLGASLLTVAVVGGAMAYFTGSLTAAPVQNTEYGYVVEQSDHPAATKVVSTINTGRAS